MACTLPCCGSFCLFVSIICAAMQFVFYFGLDGNSERIDIGDSEKERTEYAKTALWTGIVYVGLIVASVICLAAGGSKKQHDFGAEMPEDEEEAQHLMGDDDQGLTYES